MKDIAALRAAISFIHYFTKCVSPKTNDLRADLRKQYLRVALRYNMCDPKCSCSPDNCIPKCACGCPLDDENKSQTDPCKCKYCTGENK